MYRSSDWCPISRSSWLWWSTPRRSGGSPAFGCLAVMRFLGFVRLGGLWDDIGRCDVWWSEALEFCAHDIWGSKTLELRRIVFRSEFLFLVLLRCLRPLPVRRCQLYSNLSPTPKAAMPFIQVLCCLLRGDAQRSKAHKKVVYERMMHWIAAHVQRNGLCSLGNHL